MNFYVKNPSVNDAWFTVEKSASFAVVASLPQWADANSNIIYFKAKANGNDLVSNDLVGYIKNTSTIDAWYTFGEKSQIIIDAAISETSTNPLQNKVIFTEVQGLRDDIGSNQTEIEAIKQNLIDMYATQRYVENQNLLSDFEDITISKDKSAPTRMEYDGYVTFIDQEAAGVRLYINDICVGSVDNSYTRHAAVTVFVAKNDELYFYYPSKSLTTKARFYKLRDYTNRP